MVDPNHGLVEELRPVPLLVMVGDGLLELVDKLNYNLFVY